MQLRGGRDSGISPVETPVARCWISGYGSRMCRSIKTLRDGATPADDDEIRAAALQYVRKVSGYRTPSRANEEAFEHAVDHVAATTRELLAGVIATHPQRAR